MAENDTFRGCFRHTFHTLKSAIPSQPFRHAEALNRQALKALRNPFRSPPPNPLRVPLQMRHLHNEPAPFSGPPSYVTLAQRFSALSSSQISFFVHKAAKEATDTIP